MVMNRPTDGFTWMFWPSKFSHSARWCTAEKMVEICCGHVAASIPVHEPARRARHAHLQSHDREDLNVDAIELVEAAPGAGLH
jgi:hypothetical protein